MCACDSHARLPPGIDGTVSYIIRHGSVYNIYAPGRPSTTYKDAICRGVWGYAP